MAEEREQQQTAIPTTPPPESAPPYQHPADQSWNLQFLLDIKGSIAKLEERTGRVQQDIITIQNDVKGLPGRASYWAGIGLIIAVILGLAGIYWRAQPTPKENRPLPQIEKQSLPLKTPPKASPNR